MQTNEGDFTALHLASCEGHLGCVRELAETEILSGITLENLWSRLTNDYFYIIMSAMAG